MKNRIILMAAAIAAMAVSCQKEDVSTPIVKTEPVVITAGVETKTMLDGNSVKWTDGDQVAVFSRANDSGDYTQSSNAEFQATDINGNKANFKGNVVEGTKTFYAIYPYEKAVNVSGNTVTVKVPGAQTPTANTFAEEHNISVAKVTKNPGEESVEGEFKNVLALIKFTIPKNVTDATSVTITADQNIVGNLAINFGSENPTYTITTNGSKLASMTNEGGFTNNTFWFVVAPVDINTLTVSVATKKNGTYQMTKNWGDEGYSLEAGKYINLGTLEMRQVVAAANHAYDANGVLTGTQLTITLPEVDNNKTIQSTNFVVTKGDVKVTGWDEINAKTLKYEKPSSYPYLPQGTYKISGTYTTDKGVTYSISESEFVVGAPFSSGDKLGVTHKVYTSYTYYSEGNIDAANECKPLVIYNKSVVDKISPSILNNSAYNNIKSLKTNSTEGDLTVSNYGEHTVSSSFTFDGVTSTASGLTCHITGLPYTFDSQNNDSINPWTGNDVLFGGGFEIFGQKITISNCTVGMANLGGETYMEKTFFCPDVLNVSVGYNIKVQQGLTGLAVYNTVQNQCTIKVSGVEIDKKTLASQKIYINPLPKSENLKNTKSTTMSDPTASNRETTVRISNIKADLKASQSGAAISTYSEVKEFSIKYR